MAYKTTERLDGALLWASLCGQVFVLRTDTLVLLGGLDSHGVWTGRQTRPPLEALRAIREVLTEDGLCVIEERHSDGETIRFNRYRFGRLSTGGVWTAERTACLVQEWQAWFERKALDPCSGGFHLLCAPADMRQDAAAHRALALAHPWQPGLWALPDPDAEAGRVPGRWVRLSDGPLPTTK